MKNSKKAIPLSKAQMKTVVGGQNNFECDHAVCHAYCVNLGHTTGACYPPENGECECYDLGK